MIQKPQILVVDDDEPILGLMRNVLREFNFDAVTASSGAEALRQARERRPDLILIDKNMPGMSGAEVIEAFRNDGGAGTPVLILSGEPVSPAELTHLGADGAVLKPFDLVALIAEIRQHLSRVEQSV